MSRKLTYEEVRKEIEEFGCELISDSYENNKHKLTIRDNSGYMFFKTLSDIRKTNGNLDKSMIGKANPYSIYNINQYIKNNKIKVKLISEEYEGDKVPLVFQCADCSSKYTCLWGNFKNRHTNVCLKCSQKRGGKKKRVDNWKKIVEDDTNNEYKLIKVEYKKHKLGHKTPYITIKHNHCDRPEFTMWGHTFKSGCGCKPCAMKNAGLNRRGKIDDFRRYVVNSTDGEYTCVSNEYLGNDKPIIIKHLDCGNEYITVPATFKRGSRCPRCMMLLRVSYTHAVTALVLEDYYSDVYFEYDIGFRGKQGGISAYDVYVKELNLLIEFQSGYHDPKHKKIHDKDKKSFAINKGYDYIAIDHRDYTPLESIQLFFPFIKNIPDNLDLGRFQMMNLYEVQRALNSGLGVVDVAKTTGEHVEAIRSALQDGRLRYPQGYFEKHVWVGVVQLTLDGEYINSFKSVTEAKNQTGCHISGAINGEYNHAGGYIWIRKSDYDSGNYTIPSQSDMFIINKPIVQLDINGNLVRRFENRKEASQNTGVALYNINSALGRESCYSSGYFWIDEEQYDSRDYKLTKPPRQHNQAVVQLSINGDFIAEWESQIKARTIKNGNINISRAIREGKTAGGYRWMYKDEYEETLISKE